MSETLNRLPILTAGHEFVTVWLQTYHINQDAPVEAVILAVTLLPEADQNDLTEIVQILPKARKKNWKRDEVGKKHDRFKEVGDMERATTCMNQITAIEKGLHLLHAKLGVAIHVQRVRDQLNDVYEGLCAKADDVGEEILYELADKTVHEVLRELVQNEKQYSTHVWNLCIEEVLEFAAETCLGGPTGREKNYVPERNKAYIEAEKFIRENLLLLRRLNAFTKKRQPKTLAVRPSLIEPAPVKTAPRKKLREGRPLSFKEQIYLLKERALEKSLTLN